MGGGGGGGLFEMEQRGPSSKHTVSTLAVSLPWRYISLIFFYQIFKASRIVASVWNARAMKPMIAPLAPSKKKPRFLREKKGKRKLKKKEEKAVRTN